MRAFVGGVIALGLATAGCKGASKPTAVATCAGAAGKIAHGMIVVREDIATAGIDPAPDIVQLCTDDAWEPEIIRCYAAATAPRELRACAGRLSSDQRLHAREVQEELYRRASEVGDGSSGGGAIGIAACDDYLALAARYSECDQVPESVRASFDEVVAQQRERWQEAGDDDASRESVERECTAVMQDLDQRVANQGC
jgi:hypothetical protein